MSSVRSRSPAPTLSSFSGCWFCSRFCILRSLFGLVKPPDHVLDGGILADIATDDSLDLLLAPRENFADLTDAHQSLAVGSHRGVELRCRGPTQVMEVQVSFLHLRSDLGAIE